MNRVVRIAAGTLGFVLAMSGMKTEGLEVMIRIAIAALALVALVLSSRGLWRPATDAVAWLGTLAALAMPHPLGAALPRARLVAAGLLLLVALHVPAPDAPPSRLRTSLLHWGLLTSALLSAALAPLAMSSGPVQRLDPLTVAGLVVWLAACVAALCVCVLLWSTLRRLRDRVPKELPPTHA